MSIRTEIRRTENLMCKDLWFRTEIRRIEFKLFFKYPLGQKSENKDFTYFISLLGQKYAGQKFRWLNISIRTEMSRTEIINLNKSGLGQKSVGQKTFFLWKCLLGQKYAGHKFRCLYNPIRTEISRTEIYIFLIICIRTEISRTENSLFM